jgi:hypothetical protein
MSAPSSTAAPTTEADTSPTATGTLSFNDALNGFKARWNETYHEYVETQVKTGRFYLPESQPGSDLEKLDFRLKALEKEFELYAETHMADCSKEEKDKFMRDAMSGDAEDARRHEQVYRETGEEYDAMADFEMGDPEDPQGWC